MESALVTEKRLAVIAIWGLFGSFGLAFVLSFFHGGQVLLGLIGFGLFIAGFVAHIIVNHVFGVDFGNGETAAGFSLFGLALLTFILSSLFGVGIGSREIVIGVAGFAALIVAFTTYVVTKYGLKGSFSMFHQMRDGGSDRLHT